MLTKKLGLKHQCQGQILVTHFSVVKWYIFVTKKTFTADDIDAPNNIAANVTATNKANNDAFGEKKLVFKNNAPSINCI